MIENNFLYMKQYGFLHGRSTTTQLLRYLDICIETFVNGVVKAAVRISDGDRGFLIPNVFYLVSYNYMIIVKNKNLQIKQLYTINILVD